MIRPASKHALLCGVICLSAWLLPSPASAEVARLLNGGQVKGELLNPDQSPRQTYILKTPSGATITLRADQVAELIELSDELREYNERHRKSPDTLEAHWEMANWCREARLPEQREFHLNKVLQFDTDHAPARHALGYSKVNNKWVRTEEWRRNQGYVRHKGSWRLAQEVLLETQQEQQEDREREWQGKLRMWRGWIVKQRGSEREGWEGFQTLDDPAAAPGLARMLKDEELKPLRLLYVDALGRLRTSAGVYAMIDRIMKDPDADVRDRCLDELVKYGREPAVNVMIQALDHKSNQVVNLAARNLGRLGDPRAIAPLIDALHTKHKFIINPGGGGVNAGFSNDGNTFSTGGGPKQIERTLQNREVLNALIALTPQGTNFGYRTEDWKSWYGSRQGPQQVNLRRD